MNLQELIAELMKLGPKADEFADALKEGAGSHYQTIFNRGHKHATEENKGKLKTLEDEVERERDRAAKAETRAAKLKEDQPDVSAITQEYKDKIADLETQLEEAQEGGTRRVQDVLRSQSQSDLVALLMGENMGKVDETYARVLARDNIGRVRHEPLKDDPGKFRVQVMAEGSENIPIQADKPLEALAKELAENVPAKFKDAKVDNGSRTGGSGGGGGGNELYSDIRKEVKDKQEGGAKRESAADRMGLPQRT